MIKESRNIKDINPDFTINKSILNKENHISGFITQILNSIPLIAAILDSERKIIFANEALKKRIGKDNLENILSKRPGEVLSCKFLSPEKHCGEAEECKYCSALKSFRETSVTQSTVSSEWRHTSKEHGRTISYDYLVTTSPLKLDGIIYTLFILTDISDEKRRRFLERIFFHDIINSASSINGILEILEETVEPGKAFELLDVARNASGDLLEEIMAHRELLAAENNELTVKNVPVNSMKVLNELIRKISYSEYAENKTIVLSDDSANVVFSSDETLLKRVLFNMLKNALEAAPAKGRVAIGCKVDESSISFWVKNPGVISKDVGMQIFKRSFSTKGADRGLGTYSMKLLGEQLLKGTVYFESSVESDTTFFIKFNA